MSDELKPCPFCGGLAEIVDIDEGENAGGSCVCCTTCLASSKVEFGFKENFISNWNRRVQTLATDAVARLSGCGIKAARASVATCREMTITTRRWIWTAQGVECAPPSQRWRPTMTAHDTAAPDMHATILALCDALDADRVENERLRGMLAEAIQWNWIDLEEAPTESSEACLPLLVDLHQQITSALAQKGGE